MLPLLEMIADGNEHVMRDVTTQVADRFGLTEDERQEMLPSGKTPVITSRVAWAKTYLKKAGLLEQPRRGVVLITAEGKKVLDRRPKRIDNEFLKQYPSFLNFFSRKDIGGDNATPRAQARVEETQTPEETLETAYQTLRDALADELLEQVKSCSPAFFERLVVELLVAMGYGGSIEDAGQAVGKSGDGGIDGIIKEDKLGLDTVVIQAKKWTDSSIGRPDVQAFVGSMAGRRARKGVFITTSSFSKQAVEYVGQIQERVVLIDGDMLASLMIDHNIGVAAYRSFVVKKMDSDYFEE